MHRSASCSLVHASRRASRVWTGVQGAAGNADDRGARGQARRPWRRSHGSVRHPVPRVRYRRLYPQTLRYRSCTIACSRRSAFRIADSSSIALRCVLWLLTLSLLLSLSCSCSRSLALAPDPTQGLDEEGLFRISAAQSALRAVKDAYNQGTRSFTCTRSLPLPPFPHLSHSPTHVLRTISPWSLADPVDLEAVDIHTLACILKLFFRDLPTPLIPSEHYAAFISLAGSSLLAAAATSPTCSNSCTAITRAPRHTHTLTATLPPTEGSYTKDMAFDAKNPPPWVAEMKALVALLPHQNRLLLSFLMQLLADVVAHKYVSTETTLFMVFDRSMAR